MEVYMKKLHILAVAIILIVAFEALPVSAQESLAQAAAQQKNLEPVPYSGKTVPQFGGTSPVAYAVSAFACVPLMSGFSFSFSTVGGATRYCTTGACTFECQVTIPTGARITSMELDGCDTSNTASIDVNLFRQSYTGPLTNIGFISTGAAETDGCTYWQTVLTTPETVYNWINTYFAEVHLGTGTTDTAFSSVRILYELQVSPAPATATFADVPASHMFFRYVEALVNAGITGGCTATQYCPDSYLTRGQMAKFLAVALGLNYGY
jgi:hypothetical protein